MYLNGVLVSGALRAGDSYSSIKLTTQSIRVGTYRNGNGSYGLHFTGGIDDVRLWNDARTASEISGNMNNELSGNEANLAGYWKFNEGTGTTVADASPNGSNGILGAGSGTQPSWVSASGVEGYMAEVISAADYYAFGSLMPMRNASTDDYRYGFNGMENDNEVKGIGNSLDFGARIYDPRVGTWLAVDPLRRKYPCISPYNFAANNPINLRDPDGNIL